MENSKLSLLDAKRILESEHTDLLIKSGVDYDNYYVFDTEPKEHDESHDGRWLNGLLAVDKENRDIIGFNPFSFDIDAYFKAAEESAVEFDDDSKKSDQYQFADKGKSYISQLLGNKGR